MIVLDTNVLSEPLRPQPDPGVVAWLDAQHVETLYLTTITVAELLLGVAALPAGRRRRMLEQHLETSTFPHFTGRVLPFDEEAARSYAVLQAAARTSGRTLATMDGLIAAICLSHGFALATRNVSDFAAAGIEIINPWEG